MDVRHYPQGRGGRRTQYIKDILIEFGVAQKLRRRATLAEVNAGFTLLSALPGVKWQLLDWTMIAVGGNATAGTSLNIVGTSGGSAVQLAVTAIVALTRSTIVRAGVANAVVLADGASFAVLDVEKAVTCINVGAAMTTATHFDVFVDYQAIAP